MNSDCQTVFELNVGGHVYATTTEALTQKHPNSTLALLVNSYQTQEHQDAPMDNGPSVENGKTQIKLMRDAQGRLFIDRDGLTFRLILDYLRLGISYNLPLSTWVEQLIPDYTEKFRLKLESDYYGLQELSAVLDGVLSLKEGKDMKNDPAEAILPDWSDFKSRPHSTRWPSRIGIRQSQSYFDSGREIESIPDSYPSFLTIGYRSVYESQRSVGPPTSEITQFRRVTRITVSGRSDVARQVFKDDLNDSRDPNRSTCGGYGYTCRYYLKHTYLEAAFETLAANGFTMVNSSSIGSNNQGQSRTDSEAIFYREGA